MLGKSLTTRKIQIYLRYFILALKIFGACSTIFLCCFVVFSPLGQKLYLSFASKMVHSGFSLSKVVVVGHTNLPKEEVYSFIDYPNLLDIAKKVRGNPWVKSCIIKRRLPDSICIKVVERLPIAVWQYQYKYHLIDRDGECIDLETFDPQQFSHLINVVGKGANLYAYQLIQDMNRDAVLKARARVAVRYGERRWNVFLDEILIKMPEQNFVKAWTHLGEMHKKGTLFDCGVQTVDLRNEEKIYIEYR